MKGIHATLVAAGLVAAVFGGVGTGQAQVLVAAQAADTVNIGRETKNATGRVKELQAGDAACYMVMTDRSGREFTEAADFDICAQEATLVGREVRLTYRLTRVLAAACGGNPDCRKTERVALVVLARPLAAAASAEGAIPRTVPRPASATPVPPPGKS